MCQKYLTFLCPSSHRNAGFTLLEVLVALVIGFLTVATLGLAALCLIPLLCILIPLSIIISGYLSLVQNGIVLGKQGVFEALGKGWAMLRAHFWPITLMALILFVIGALAGLLILSPFMLLIALLIKRNSPGPVFFLQERCGEKGRKFKLIKFRTMYVNAEAGTGPVWTVENDPRCTSIGSFLRRFNIDELPQLWNVLRGEMSLVGPRPERPFFVEQFKEDINRYMWRHVSRPGMTGWAQVNGLRGNTDVAERIKYDLYYLENWSLAFDFKILLKTFRSRQNAY